MLVFALDSRPVATDLEDLLVLGALSCPAPVVMVSLPQPDGSWMTSSYGLEADRPEFADLIDLLVASKVPLDFADLMQIVPRSPLVRPPHSFRWAYGSALRDDDGLVMGVFAVMDRWLHQPDKREQKALTALARSLDRQLRKMADSNRSDAAEGSSLEATPASTPVDLTQVGHLLRSHEVAEIFHVTERTVVNWAATGRIPSIRTFGGQFRFRPEDVMERLAAAATSA